MELQLDTRESLRSGRQQQRELRVKLNIKYRSCSSWFLILSIPREVLILGQLESILFTICSVEAYETTAKGYKKANSCTRFSVGNCGLSFLTLRNTFGSQRIFPGMKNVAMFLSASAALGRSRILRLRSPSDPPATAAAPCSLLSC